MKQRIDVAKILFYSVSISTVIAISFAFGVYSTNKQNAVFKSVQKLETKIEDSLNITTEEIGNLTKTRPTHFLQPSRYEGEGVIKNITPDDNALIFMAGFFENDNGLQLINRDGRVVAHWRVRFSDIFTDISHLTIQPPATDWNIDIHGALILPDGSVVFNFEYAGLVKLDRCGKVVWTSRESTHHSVELAEGGGFWVPSRQVFLPKSTSPFPPFGTPFYADTILKISDDGQVVNEISVPRLFYENDLEALLTATGESFRVNRLWDREIIHLNKIEELTSDIADDFPMFEAGDLLLSLREQNLLLVVEPDTHRIKWWKIGPWVRQHDPEFQPGGFISVFNNNVYRDVFGIGPDISPPNIKRVSNVIQIDPVSGKYSVVYGGKPGQEMMTVIRGKHELTESGGLLITEFEGGRVFETDSKGRKIWEYINRYNPEEVAEITEARIYPASYFNVSDWNCIQ